jgi:cobyric acid synthase
MSLRRSSHGISSAFRGSKDTIAGLWLLKARGFASAICAHAERGDGSAAGLGLLRVRTRLRPATVTRRAQVRWLPRSVHGRFDARASRRHVLRWSGRGHAGGIGGDTRTLRDFAYDRVADALEAAVGMEVLRRLLRR